MRVLVAAALCTSALVVAGCGGSSAGVAHAAAASGDAATLVPRDATAFVAVSTDFTSEQWQRIDSLAKTFPARAKLMEKLLHGLDLKKDVAPALGPELDVAVLGKGEVAGFTKPTDESKLKTLLTKLSTPSDQYSVEEIGGWSVVADSQDVFAKVQGVQSGQSLSDQLAFQQAWRSVPDDAVARLYASGPQVDWIAAGMSADADALRLHVVVRPSRALPVLGTRLLLGDVPSGAQLAVSFRGSADLLQRLPNTTLPLKQLAPLLSGGGVLYVRTAGLIPDVALELAPKDPAAALASARALLHSVAGRLGPLRLTAQLSGGKLVIADSPAAASALRSGPKLVDDPAFKDALKRAGVPAQTTFVAYADVSQLAPFVPLVLQGITGKTPDPSLGDNLAHVGTVVAWGTRSGALVHLYVWVQPR